LSIRSLLPRIYVPSKPSAHFLNGLLQLAKGKSKLTSPIDEGNLSGLDAERWNKSIFTKDYE
jgi:hypothetical protein